jgi:glycerophosphoryl diester phosphodiesterase
MTFKPKIIYHRGRHGQISNSLYLNENTLAAISQAIEESAEIIEIDVWNDLKVMHDPGDMPAPKLLEIIDLIDAQCSLNIEIKSPKVAVEVIKIVKQKIEAGKWKSSQFIISAFHHQTALYCKQELPNVRVAVISDGIPLPSYLYMLAEEGIQNLHVQWANIYMDIEANYEMRRVVRECKMEIWVWTVNSKEIYNTLCLYGVDAIFTDRPELFR